MKFLIKVVFTAIAVMLAAYILPGIEVNNFWIALLLAFVLAILNTFVRPVLLFISIPATILTLGLFIFVINAVVVLLAAKIMNYVEPSSFLVNSFGWALLFSVVVSFISSLLNGFIKNDEKPKQLNN